MFPRFFAERIREGGGRMEDDFRGMLKPAFELGEGPFLLVPVFLVPVEIFSRGMMTRTSYSFHVALVDAVNGQVTLLPQKSVSILETEPPQGKRLNPKVRRQEAVELAEEAGRSMGKGKWTGAFRYNSVMVDQDHVSSTWRVWKVEGDSLVDSLTGRRENLGFLVAALIGGETGNPRGLSDA
jgi:hypothetical protein